MLTKLYNLRPSYIDLNIHTKVFILMYTMLYNKIQYVLRYINGNIKKLQKSYFLIRHFSLSCNFYITHLFGKSIEIIVFPYTLKNQSFSTNFYIRGYQ